MADSNNFRPPYPERPSPRVTEARARGLPLSPEQIRDQGLTARGAELVEPQHLTDALDYLLKHGFYVRSIEAFELRDGREILDIGLSMLGLDGEDDWSDDERAEKHTSLVWRKVQRAQERAGRFGFTVWLDVV